MFKFIVLIKVFHKNIVSYEYSDEALLAAADILEEYDKIASSFHLSDSYIK